MSNVLHGILGWAAVAIVLMAGLHARARVRSGRAYEGGLYRAAAVFVDIQVLIGILVWVDGQWWDVRGMFAQSWLHPALAIATLGLTHFGIKRAHDERWAAEAYGIASRTLLLAAVLLTVAAGLAFA